jgi:hypothetical protein
LALSYGKGHKFGHKRTDFCGQFGVYRRIEFRQMETAEAAALTMSRSDTVSDKPPHPPTSL